MTLGIKLFVEHYTPNTTLMAHPYWFLMSHIIIEFALRNTMCKWQSGLFLADGETLLMDSQKPSILSMLNPHQGWKWAKRWLLGRVLPHCVISKCSSKFMQPTLESSSLSDQKWEWKKTAFPTCSVCTGMLSIPLGLVDIKERDDQLFLHPLYIVCTYGAHWLGI